MSGRADERAVILALYGLKSLAEATQDTWPWWRWTQFNPDDSEDIRRLFRSYLPNFTESRDAVWLAEKMGDGGTLCMAVSERGWAVPYRGVCGEGDTLGAALLDALAKAQGGASE